MPKTAKRGTVELEVGVDEHCGTYATLRTRRAVHGIAIDPEELVDLRDLLNELLPEAGEPKSLPDSD